MCVVLFSSNQQLYSDMLRKRFREAKHQFNNAERACLRQDIYSYLPCRLSWLLSLWVKHGHRSRSADWDGDERLTDGRGAVV